MKKLGNTIRLLEFFKVMKNGQQLWRDGRTHAYTLSRRELLDRVSDKIGDKGVVESVLTNCLNGKRSLPLEFLNAILDLVGANEMERVCCRLAQAEDHDQHQDNAEEAEERNDLAFIANAIDLLTHVRQLREKGHNRQAEVLAISMSTYGLQRARKMSKDNANALRRLVCFFLFNAVSARKRILRLPVDRLYLNRNIDSLNSLLDEVVENEGSNELIAEIHGVICFLKAERDYILREHGFPTQDRTIIGQFKRAEQFLQQVNSWEALCLKFAIVRESAVLFGKNKELSELGEMIEKADMLSTHRLATPNLIVTVNTGITKGLIRASSNDIERQLVKEHDLLLEAGVDIAIDAHIQHEINWSDYYWLYEHNKVSSREKSEAARNLAKKHGRMQYVKAIDSHIAIMGS